MNKQVAWLGVCVMGGLLPIGVVTAAERPFPLASYIPEDVLVYVGERHNPELRFVEDYWGEVITALGDAGIGNDVLQILGDLMGPDAAANAQRLRARGEQLLAGVNWAQLAGQELAFAERLSEPRRFAEQGIYWGPPEMVFLFSLPEDAVEPNYEGLVKILEAIADEINRVADGAALRVKRFEEGSTVVAAIDLLAALPGTPELPLTVFRHGTVVGIAMNSGLVSDVVGLLEGKSYRAPLSKEPRFLAALQELPPAEGMMTFFSMPAMLRPFHQLTDVIAATVSAPEDIFINTGMDARAGRLHEDSLAAYRSADYANALKLTEQAYAIESNNCFITYNMACFNALNGHRAEALSWLERAVDGGFFAPNKIATDSDLVSLRDDPRYEQALDRAMQQAREGHVEDIVINSSKSDAAYSLITQAWQAAENRQYDNALRLAEQAFEMSPEDARVLYALACFHTLRGHEERALQFLEKAVDAGYFCPGHIAADANLEAIRTHARYEQVLARARGKAAAMTSSRADDKLELVTGVLQGAIAAFEVVDYSATVQTTSGYSIHTHSVASLVPRASEHPIYPVLAARRPQEQFARYLPVETESFEVSSGVDFQALYRYALGVLERSGPAGRELLDEWTAVQQRGGFNVADDVLRWIDGAYVTVTLADGKGDVMLLKVTEEAEARKQMSRGLDHVIQLLGQAVREVPALAMIGLRRSPTDHPELVGFENIHMALSPTPVVWGVADGHAIVGTSADAIALCLRTARGEHPNVRQNERLMSEAVIPDGAFYSVSLADQRRMGEEIAGVLQMVTIVIGPMTMSIPNESVRMVLMKVSGIVGKLVPVASQIDFYKSSASSSTFDGSKWIVHQVTHYKSPEERAAANP